MFFDHGWRELSSAEVLPLPVASAEDSDVEGKDGDKAVEAAAKDELPEVDRTDGALPGGKIEDLAPSPIGVDGAGDSCPWLVFGFSDDAPEPEVVLALPAKPANIPKHGMVKKWIIDSGCGHDLVSKTLVMSFPQLIHSTDKSITFNTANGLAPTSEQAHIGVPELSQIVRAWVMERSPAVLSLERRCM